MPNINDVINTLSEDELDLLNSDSEMLAAFKKKYQPDEGSHVTAGDVGRAAWDTVKDVGTLTKAGGAGIADLIAHPLDTAANAVNIVRPGTFDNSDAGIKKAVENIGHVKKDEDLTSGAAVIGDALGSQFTPGQIALQATFGKIAEMVGPTVANMMRGWSESAARMAVGATKKICEAIGVTDLSAVAQFLLQPIEFAGKKFAPIITATSTAEDMLAAAKTVQSAAGKTLESVAAKANGAIKASIDESVASPAMGEAKVVMMDVPALQQKITALEENVSLKRLGKTVIKQYQEALADLNDIVTKALKGDSKSVFSDLAKAKTDLGDLIYKHGSPLESKTALLDVYRALSEMLSETAEKVGGETAADYAAANAVYSKVTTIVGALEGKVLSNAAAGTGIKAFLNDPAALIAGLGVGHASGPLALITGPAAFLATKGAENYGPQAIAAGLNKAAPLVAGGIELTARGIPVVGRALADGRAVIDALTSKQDGQ